MYILVMIVGFFLFIDCIRSGFGYKGKKRR